MHLSAQVQQQKKLNVPESLRPFLHTCDQFPLTIFILRNTLTRSRQIWIASRWEEMKTKKSPQNVVRTKIENRFLSGGCSVGGDFLLYLIGCQKDLPEAGSGEVADYPLKRFKWNNQQMGLKKSCTKWSNKNNKPCFPAGFPSPPRPWDPSEPSTPPWQSYKNMFKLKIPPPPKKAYLKILTIVHIWSKSKRTWVVRWGRMTWGGIHTKLATSSTKRRRIVPFNGSFPGLDDKHFHHIVRHQETRAQGQTQQVVLRGAFFHNLHREQPSGKLNKSINKVLGFLSVPKLDSLYLPARCPLLPRRRRWPISVMPPYPDQRGHSYRPRWAIPNVFNVTTFQIS